MPWFVLVLLFLGANGGRGVALARAHAPPPPASVMLYRDCERSPARGGRGGRFAPSGGRGAKPPVSPVLNLVLLLLLLFGLPVLLSRWVAGLRRDVGLQLVKSIAGRAWGVLFLASRPR